VGWLLVFLGSTIEGGNICSSSFVTLLEGCPELQAKTIGVYLLLVDGFAWSLFRLILLVKHICLSFGG
jgi:hypothetical protein